MKNYFFYLILGLFLIGVKLNAQNSSSSLVQQDRISAPVRTEIFTIGVGAGFDYGGFGVNYSFYPQENFGLFAGVGYALAGVGFNGGARFRITPKKPLPKFIPYIVGMYGYNAAIKVTDAKEYNKLFYGPTLGFGVDYHPVPGKNGYFSLGLMIPFRGSEPKYYIEDLEQNHGVEFSNGLFPVTISVGYRLPMF